MDFEFIREQTPLYVEAAKLTLHMAVIGVLLAIVVGLICSMIKYFRIPVLRQIVECYIELSRNTPLLIQLFFLYFGLPKIGIVLSSEQCAITGLTFLGGSYMAEAFRSGGSGRYQHSHCKAVSFCLCLCHSLIQNNRTIFISGMHP